MLLHMMHKLRCVFLYGTFYGFQFSAEHMPGVVNTVADALSRDRADLASTVVSQIPKTQVPTHIHQGQAGHQGLAMLFTDSLRMEFAQST